jgi:glycosyltransferase involved in cell wall biosynthesis
LKEILEIRKITEHVWSEDSIPTVSISCIAFNQSNYIRETLDGFLGQETNFLVEILIHDDASSDGTDLIILEYANKYPNIFKPLLQKVNQYSKIGFSLGFLEFKRARGKYIAICEGDDYWSDTRKLLKQVDLLEKETNVSFCFHSTKYLYNTSDSKLELNRPKFIPINNKFELKHLIELDSQLISNCSVMMRSNQVQKFPQWVSDAPVGDLPLCLYLGTLGSMAYIDEAMSVYRVNSIGSWSNELASSRSYRIRHLKKLRIMWLEFDNWTDYTHSESIKIRIRQINRAILIARLSSISIFRLLLKVYRKNLT